MDARELVAALGRAGVHDVSVQPLDLATHAADASLYRVLPTAVVRPRHVDELDAVLGVARASGTSVTMRGAGTSIAGNAIGPGLVVDTSRHLNRILALDIEAGLAVVEPGVVHASLQREAQAAGWRFGPDPSTHSRCTIGGMVGNNACGSRALGYGRTADNVEALDVTWGSGERQRLAPGVRDGVAGRLAELVAADLGHARTTFGQFSRQVSGYSAEHLLPERLRPERFVVGSEGTLALVRRAEVRLVRDAPHTALVVLGYPSMIEAADAVPGLLRVERLVACEGLDSRIVRLVAGAPDLPRGSGWLFVEVVGTDPGLVDARVRAAVAAAGALAHRRVDDPAQAAALWRIREDGAGLAARSLDRPAHSGWEDAAVPPALLGAWLREFEALLLEHGLQGVPYGHFGDGCLHARIDFDFDDGGARFRRFLTDCATALAAHGGSLSGEHGDGRARSELLPLMYDSASIRLFEGLKAVADPDTLLNPGVLVRPVPVDADLRPARPRLPLVSGRLVADLGAEVHRCTGVGKCVAGPSSSSVMCPSWQATREEKDSTRGRARVLQEAIDAAGVLAGLGDEAVSEALDLCLGCKGCASDCPTGVDMAAYRSEVLDRSHAGVWGFVSRPRSHHALGRLPQLLASPLRPVLRAGIGAARRFRVVGAVAKALAGVDRRRGLPVPDAVSVRRGVASGAGAALGVAGVAGAGGVVGAGGSGGVDVWLWADSFTDHFGTRIAEAARAVLADAGLRMGVITERACCGLTLVSTGQLTAAARSADQAVAVLAPYAESGALILALEPSCVATLRSDAVRLSSDPRAAQVASSVLTFAELLEQVVEGDRPPSPSRGGRPQGWRPPSLAGVTVVAQPHCHQHAVLGWERDEALLRSAGAEVVRVGGCCGLAGDFGMVPEHHDVSVAVAGLQLLPAVAAHPGAVVLADGMSCRTQLGDLSDARPLHLAELLASRLG